MLSGRVATQCATNRVEPVGRVPYVVEMRWSVYWRLRRLLLGAIVPMFASFSVVTLADPRPAVAAGSGYTTPSPPPGQAPGFSKVITAKTFSPTGGQLSAHYLGDLIVVTVPKGDFKKGVQVVLTQGDNATVFGDLLGVPLAANTVLSFGVLLKRGSDSIGADAPVSVAIRGTNLINGDVVVVYRSGHFVRLETVTKSGQVSVFFRDGEQIAVVTP
jgi:hypothetical protein